MRIVRITGFNAKIALSSLIVRLLDQQEVTMHIAVVYVLDLIAFLIFEANNLRRLLM